MTTTETQKLHEDAGQEAPGRNAPKSSRKVRELAHRSFRLLKAGAQPDVGTQDPIEIRDDLRDLREQIARLQQKIHARQLKALIPWVDALSHQVEDRLGSAESHE